MDARLSLERMVGITGHVTESPEEKRSENPPDPAPAPAPGLAGAGLLGLGGSCWSAGRLGGADGRGGGAAGRGGGFFAGASSSESSPISCWSISGLETNASSSARLSCQLPCCEDTCHSTPPALSTLPGYPRADLADKEHLN